MRQIAFSMVLVSMLVTGSSSAALLVDFGRPDTPVQEGYQGFQAIHEDALSLYAAEFFGVRHDGDAVAGLGLRSALGVDADDRPGRQ